VFLQLYKCFCNTSARTKVHLWKREAGGREREGEGGGGGAEKKNKEDKSVPVTAAKTNTTMRVEMEMEESAAANKPAKKQKNKRNKTAGLIIPQKSSSQKSANINFSKLSQIFQQQQHTESLTPQSKLNQFFK
jgi:hypothetical protein